MAKSFILISLLVGTVSFSGCGSDSSTNDDSPSSSSSSSNTSNDSSNNDSLSNSSGLSITPVTTKNVCEPKVMTINNSTSSIKYATDGDITVICKTSGQYSYGEYQLLTGIDTLTITQIKRVENFVINEVQAKGSDITTYDYKAGTVHHNVDVVAKGETYKYNCTETFSSPLPDTLTDEDSINNLLEWEGDENHLIKTTCPKSYYDEGEEEDEDDFTKGTMNSLTNYTLTDSNNKTHLITESATYTIK